MIYDIFISYRNEGGFETAKHLNDLLVNDGYNVSFDKDMDREGDFDKTLFERIEQCRDFLVVVDQHAFDRMINPAPDYDPEKDWMRKEIAYALTLKRNIISVILPNASYPKKLPEDLDKLDVKNGPKYSKDYFDSFYDKLKNKFLYSIPRNVQHPNHGAQGAKVATTPAHLKVKADLDCNFFVDGEEQEKLKAGRIRKLPLAEGQYELDFVSVENESDRLVMTYEMPKSDTVLHVGLAAIRTKRLEKEVAEQEAKRKAFLQDQIIPVRGMSIVMKPVEGGTFWMGEQKADPYGQNYDEEAYDSESPVHSVTVDSFYMSETVVTQALWKDVMGDKSNNPSYFEGDNLPVEQVSWNDCLGFIRKLNRMTGKNFRLPTEAEWEYAARGGNVGNQSYGSKYSGSDTIDDVAWYYGNSGNKTHAVKTKFPNELSIYDMSGNVWEWCSDARYDYKSGEEVNPKYDGQQDSPRVLRGGSWSNYAEYCRVSSRSGNDPDGRSRSVGFRLVLPQ